MSEISKEIVKESQAFVRKNKSLLIDTSYKKSKKYLSPRISSEFMDCSLPMTFDNYSHCSLGCSYCFSYMQKSNNPNFTDKLHTINIEEMLTAMDGNPRTVRSKLFYEHFYKKRFVLHWGGLADPFCNFEKANHKSYDLIKGIASQSYPTLFSFKGGTVFTKRFKRLFSRFAGQKNFAFQVSIIAPRDDLSRKIEIGVPTTTKRIKALKMLGDMGYYTVLRLRPFIIGITDDGLGELLERCKEAGIDAISTEFLALDARSNEALMKRYRWIGELIGIGQDKVMDYFHALSPSERGGYLRLNRLVKERFIRQVYEFCVDNNIQFACSDPDFKELNMTGSCCGLPYKYKPNKELQNWTKNQLTYHLKEARKAYHKDGKITTFRFEGIFKPKQDTFLQEQKLGNDHLSAIGKPSSERKSFDFYILARDIWNNLRSPGNPRNYFHGKMMPTRTDEHGDLIYVYNPSDYEERWKEEGVDLTK